MYQAEVNVKRLPIGKQVYRDLIEGNFVYVDKTPFLVELAESGIATFLSRPRRFGKSLTVNTFKEMFLGSRELFKNTFAYDNWDFTRTSPVIKLDMSVVQSTDNKSFSRSLMSVIDSNKTVNAIEIKEEELPGVAFRELISNLSNRDGKAVVLIDEYDAPILDSLGKKILAEIKDLLRGFYKVLKEQEENIRFVFITGISKFSKVGVFSALNNLQDITLHEKYSAITGYTKEELSIYFESYIREVQKKSGLSKEEFDEKLKHYYNGYSWDGATFMYNPFSILCFFDRKVFAPYWMETGSPSFMMHYAETKKLNFDNLEGKTADISFLSEKDIDESSPESFLTQAGYLTIKEHNPLVYYVLDFPNFEVKHAFTSLLLTAAYQIESSDVTDVKVAMLNALDTDNTSAFLEQIKVIYSSVPAIYFQGNRNEYFYSSILYMYLTAAGFKVTAEKYSNKGRMDITLFWKKERVYVIELKSDSAQHALQQIKDKNYAGQFANRTVILVGLKIDFEQRNTVDWVVE
jgi:hypothetical protein